MKNIILITTSSFEMEGNPYLNLLAERGFEFILNQRKRKMTSEEICALFSVHQPIGVIAGVEPLGKNEMQYAVPALKFISRCGAGLDTVDLNAARHFNIQVLNTPDAPTPSVAELAFAHMMCCLRQVPQADRVIRASNWASIKGGLLQGKTVGIVGYGRIGKKLTRLLSGFDVKILACDPVACFGENPYGVTFVSLNELISNSDILTLHLPYSSETHHIINAKRISSMKPGSILINVARGGLVDEVALHHSLSSGHLFAAGIDVFENEPYQGVLADLPNVVLTCHMGSSAQETRQIMEREATLNLFNGLKSLGIFSS